MTPDFQSIGLAALDRTLLRQFSETQSIYPFNSGPSLYKEYVAMRRKPSVKKPIPRSTRKLKKKLEVQKNNIITLPPGMTIEPKFLRFDATYSDVGQSNTYTVRIINDGRKLIGEIKRAWGSEEEKQSYRYYPFGTFGQALSIGPAILDEIAKFCRWQNKLYEDKKRADLFDE